jgi:hypothetical protein
MIASIKFHRANARARHLPCLGLAAVSIAVLHAGAASAQTAAPAAAPAAPAAPATVSLPTPGMSAPLSLNPNPYTLDVGPLGKWYVTGAVSGLGFAQSNATATDESARLDVNNAQVFIQKTDGILQFYAQAGLYTLLTVGSAYVPVTDTTHDYFGAVPQAFIKLVPNSSWTIEGGKLPTLIGAESTFSFEDIDIERGLLWNQEPAVSRGVQVSYVKNTVTLNLSLNDGYYSNVYNWLSGSLVWAMNSASTLTFAAGGNLGHTDVSTFATPLAQNNSSIYNLIYTYSSGKWTITPYAQVSVVKSDARLGFYHAADSYSGAVLANYAFTSNFSLGGRAEYITTTGSAADGAPSLLYGPGSKAFSLTATPTYQFNRFYIRGDISYVKAASLTSGDGFGKDGADKDQVRGVLEVGVLF